MSDAPFKQADLQEFRRLIEEGYEVVDVRENHEWAAGHVPGARHVVLNALLANPTGHRLQDRTVFICEAGARSAIAAEMAVALGVRDVVNYTGGTAEWRRAGLPLEKP